MGDRICAGPPRAARASRRARRLISRAARDANSECPAPSARVLSVLLPFPRRWLPALTASQSDDDVGRVRRCAFRLRRLPLLSPPPHHISDRKNVPADHQRRARRHDPGADASTDSDAARVLLYSGKWEHPAGLTPSWREPATIPRQAGGAASSLVLGPRSEYNTFTLCSFGNFAFGS